MSTDDKPVAKEGNQDLGLLEEDDEFEEFPATGNWIKQAWGILIC